MHIEVKGAIMATDARVKAEQEKAERVLVTALGEERAQKLIANRVRRDGDKAHVTLAGPQDGKKAVDYVASTRGVSKTARLKGYPIAMDMNLRSKIIRLAHQNPELRPHLLPVLKTAKSELYKLLEGYYNSEKESDKKFSQAVAEAKKKYDEAIDEANDDYRATHDHAERVLESALEEKFTHIPAVQEYFNGPDALDREELFNKVKQQKL